MWTRCPIVKVAMGCRTELAIVHIAHVSQKLHFFQFFNFFNNVHNLPQKKLRGFTTKKILPQRENYTHLPQKKITPLDNFFLYELHFSLPKQKEGQCFKFSLVWRG